MKYWRGIPKTKKEPHIGDIWLVQFPFKETGNFGKVRPALVLNYDDENEKIIVRMITSKSKHKGKDNFEIPFNINKNKKDKRKSFLGKVISEVPINDLIIRIKSHEEIKRYKLNEIK